MANHKLITQKVTEQKILFYLQVIKILKHYQKSKELAPCFFFIT